MDGGALRTGLEALGYALRPAELEQLVRQLGGGRHVGRAELAAGLLDWPALQVGCLVIRLQIPELSCTCNLSRPTRV